MFFKKTKFIPLLLSAMIATSVVVPSLSVSAATTAPSVSQSASESIGSHTFNKSMTFKVGQTLSANRGSTLRGR